MKIRISNMMDYTECIPLEWQERGNISAYRIKTKTLNKIHELPSTARHVWKIPKAGIVIAVLALCISITAVAATATNWNGFAYTGDLSGREQKALMRDATTAYPSAVVNECDGSVHYLDKNGKEIMVLSAEEAMEYENARATAKEQAILESTSLVDVSTLPLLPAGITEMETSADGKFTDFMMGNAHMVLLHPCRGDSYQLVAGDVVTITLDANDKCYLEFGVFQDGNFKGAETLLARQHCYTFIASEDGLYNFSVKYCSAGASSFINCIVAIHEEM